MTTDRFEDFTTEAVVLPAVAGERPCTPEEDQIVLDRVTAFARLIVESPAHLRGVILSSFLLTAVGNTKNPQDAWDGVKARVERQLAAVIKQGQEL